MILLFVWLAPYVLIGVTIIILWKITKLLLKMAQDKTASNITEPICVPEEHKPLSYATKDNVSELTASLPTNINGAMVNAVHKEEIQNFENVPYWEHSYVYSVDALQNANIQQKAFYYYFKSQFLDGQYVNILDNSNYAFVLMFDLAGDYYVHRDYEKLKLELYTLAEHYPVVERYIKRTITEVVIKKERKDAKRILSSYDKSRGQLCRWITPNETIEVQGIQLVRGNFYLGDCFLLPDRMIRDNYNMWGEKIVYIYGSVLNPNLLASNTKQLDKAFCSYYDMSPAWRYEYLMWLSGQKAASDVPTEILLFYLYGCEVRMFIDSETTMPERQTILSDMIELYGSLDFGSIRGNGWYLRDRVCDFIVYGICNYFRTKIVDYKIKSLLNDNSTYQSYYLEQMLHSKKELSVDDIFKITTDIYDIGRIVPVNYISIARELFTERFTELHVNLNVDFETTRKQYRYLWCNDNNSFFSPGLEKLSLFHEVDMLPNGLLEIREAIRICYLYICSKFRNYNKIKERHDGKETVAAIFLLPDKVKVSEIPRIQQLISSIENEIHSMMYLVKPISWFLELWEYKRKNDKSIHIEYADSIIGGLHRIGFDIVPDYQLDRKRFNFDDICVIYRNEKHLQVNLTKRYELSVLFINLATQIVQADKVTDSDFAFVEQQLKAYNQTDGNYLHLSAFARWRFLSLKRSIDKQSLSVIKTLKRGELTSMGNALLMLACTNGYIHPKRIDSLKKVLSLLGQETDNIHAQAYRLLTDSEGFAVVEKKIDAVEFSIKKENSSVEQSDVQSVIIDPKRLQLLKQQTEAAHALLSDIFFDGEEVKLQNKTSDETPKVWMNILEQLFTKEIWERAEVDNMCKQRGLMLGAVLEQINDFAYEKIDDAVVEDDGTNIYVTMNYKKELI